MYRLTLFLAIASLSFLHADDIKLQATDVKVNKITLSTPEPTGLESVKKGDAPKDVQKPLLEAIFKTSHVAPYVTLIEKKYADAIATAKKASEFHVGNTVEVDCQKFIRGPADGKMCWFKAVRRYGWYANPFLVEEVEGYVTELQK